MKEDNLVFIFGFLFIHSILVVIYSLLRFILTFPELTAEIISIGVCSFMGFLFVVLSRDD